MFTHSASKNNIPPTSPYRMPQIGMIKQIQIALFIEMIKNENISNQYVCRT